MALSLFLTKWKKGAISNSINNLQWYVSFYPVLYNFNSPQDKKAFINVRLTHCYIKIGIIIISNYYADKLFVIIMLIIFMFQKFCGICISYVLWSLSFSWICDLNLATNKNMWFYFKMASIFSCNQYHIFFKHLKTS